MPNTNNPLNSENWVSESSAQSPSGNGSGSPDPSCKGCHVDFLEDEETVAWSEGGTYSASDNLDRGGDFWEPDFWELEVIDGGGAGSESETDATIDPDTGEVTFGSIGQSVKITAKVKRCVNCAGRKKVHIRQLSIVRDEKDVTDQKTTAFAGEPVVLTGRVLPAKFNGEDWFWAVPATTIKEFRVSVDHRSGQRIDYKDGDWQRKICRVHWVDGSAEGLDKEVTVQATVDGVQMAASTKVTVKRPSATMTTSVTDPRIGKNPDVAPDQWGGLVDVEFKTAGDIMDGEIEWVQIGTYKWKRRDRFGTASIYDSSGLDSCIYPSHSTDKPFSGFTAKYLFIEFSYNFQTWMMWRYDVNSEWVPLSSCEWWFSGTMIPSAKDPAVPVWRTVNPPLINPSAGSDQPKTNELDYPTWTNCLIP